MTKHLLNFLIFACLLFLGSQVSAQFSGPFDPSNWTLSGISASSDASVNTTGAPGSITFTGNDSDFGDCCGLYDQYSITIPTTCDANTLISFDYNFSQPDIEEFYYVVNGTATFVTDQTQTGNLSVVVPSGGTFAFRIYTDDDCCGAGVLTITNFTFDSDYSAPVASVGSLTDVSGTCSVNAPTAPTANDGCAGVITGTTTTTWPVTIVGTTVVTWSYDDGNGNVSTQTQNIIVTDAVAPVPDSSSLSDITAGCSIDMPIAPTATDNCAGTITGTTSTIFPITTLGTTVITWTFDDGNGNVATQDQNIIVNNTLALTATTTLENAGNDGTIDLTITGNTGTPVIDWDNDGTGDNDDSEDLSGLSAGVYNVTVTDGGCSASLAVTVNNVGFESTEILYSVYPNPTNGLLTVSVQGSDTITIKITDSTGRLVAFLNTHSGTSQLDLSDFEPGVYVVEIQGNNHSSKVSIILQ